MKKIFAILLLSIITNSSFSEESASPEDIHAGVWPIMLLSLAGINWMVHEGGRDPENAQYFYAIGMFASAQELDSRFGKLAFAGATAMVLTNYHYENNPPESSAKSRQANLSAFWLSLVSMAVINTVLGEKKPDNLNVDAISTIGSYELKISYDF